MSNPLVLSFDTSAAHVAAALLCGDQIIARKVEEMKRGQAERLMPLIEEVLAEGGKTFADLDAIGVGVGPGNFTGIRISVSAARGLALGLGIPAVGVNSFDAIEAGLSYPAIPVVPAPRGQGYLSPKDGVPYLASESELMNIMEDCPLATPKAESLVDQIARLAAVRYQDSATRPAPLYIKPADAAPTQGPGAGDPAMTAEEIAALYAAAFPSSRGWSAAEISDMLASPLTFEITEVGGFALGRVVADEAELLTIAVDPVHQRKGIGQKLLKKFESESESRGAATALLEVAQDNAPALALYQRSGYEICGERPDYYRRPDGTQITASLMKKALQ